MCMKSKVRWKPITKARNAIAEAFAQHSSGDFRIPVIECGEQREQNSAHDHVVKVRDDEVRNAKLPIEGRRRQA